ncbi:ribosome maturation factor RimP [Nocardia donostiensis]|uniref:Ribosome maturation factor RimP n=1 Tax=Nocardia donostiensis TaxID=1538463 RepID=A0A1V2T9L7_9NOCA|nr:ribosome maturation factor RimP [Nocardia donostiensis]ONM46210.1 ribosome maturation factor RimP [Nocardia donostiensis]OQS14929.1 ribosome maturation factor RimP [Nocardia donostiensis]OQS18259.1 ribosome maturation factor RimP [Nocardia donostiensis]
MPMPTEERVSQLVAGLVEGAGFDLEGVVISAVGGQARVRVIVDSDDAADLDAIAALSGEISARLDTADEFGATSYLLEVTTPGIDRPLTLERHWRRARGRKARITLRPGVRGPEPGGAPRFEARIGELVDDTVALVLGGKNKPYRVRIPLRDIAGAVVQVEFSPPGVRELELAGGVAPGRPPAGADAADVTGKTKPVAASDSTEGTME